MVLKYWCSYGKYPCFSMIKGVINRIYLSWVDGYSKSYVKSLTHFRPLWKLFLTSPLVYSSNLFLKELLICILSIILLVAIIFSMQVYISLYFLPILFEILFFIFLWFLYFLPFFLVWIWYYLHMLFNICLT